MFKLKTSLLMSCSVAFVYLKKVFCSQLIFFFLWSMAKKQHIRTHFLSSPRSAFIGTGCFVTKAVVCQHNVPFCWHRKLKIRHVCRTKANQSFCSINNQCQSPRCWGRGTRKLSAGKATLGTLLAPWNDSFFPYSVSQGRRASLTSVSLQLFLFSPSAPTAIAVFI